MITKRYRCKLILQILIGSLVLSLVFLGAACVGGSSYDGGGASDGGGVSDGGGGSAESAEEAPRLFQVEQELLYQVIDAGVGRECGAARIPPEFPPADFITAHVELQNTDNVGGEFRVKFYFATNEQNYTHTDLVYIAAGQSKILRSEQKVEIWEKIEDWHYEVIPGTKTVAIWE